MRLDGAELDRWSDEDHGQVVGYLPPEIELMMAPSAKKFPALRLNPTAER